MQIFRNANLATMRESGEAFGNITAAAFVIAEGEFVWLGKEGELPDEYQSFAAIDLNGQWVTPGLIDCHTHLVYAGDRAREFDLRLNGASYAEIAQAGGGIVSTVRNTREANFNDLFAQSSRRLQVMLSEGVTTVEIKSGYGLDQETEIRMLKVARKLGETYPVNVQTTFLGAHAVPPEFIDRADDYVSFICEEVLPSIASERLADAVDAFCETIGFSVSQIERVFKTAQKLGLSLKLHAEQLSDQGGASLAARYNALSADHLEFLSIAGIEAMQKAGTVAVLLPGAYYYLRETQLPPIQKLRDAQVPIAIATDCNPGSSPIVSLQLMINMACTLFRLTPEEALAGVTRNAAKALGLAATHGSLQQGKAADFVVWNISDPAMLAYQVGLNPLSQVYKDGVCVRSVS